MLAKSQFGERHYVGMAVNGPVSLEQIVKNVFPWSERYMLFDLA